MSAGKVALLPCCAGEATLLAYGRGREGLA
jgi:hypothetical protein